MKNYNTFMCGKIFSAAEKVLDAIERLPEILKEWGVELPAEYDGTRKGGYLALYQRSKSHETGELLLLGKIGIIPDQKDDEYGNKNAKYRKFAETKCQFLMQTSDAITSGETAFKIKGGVKVNDSLVLGFSGRSQLEDELLVIATARKCKLTLDKDNVFGGDGRLIEITDIEGNPFLCQKIVNAIIHAAGEIE
jgi:hypothetical protein